MERQNKIFRLMSSLKDKNILPRKVHVIAPGRLSSKWKLIDDGQGGKEIASFLSVDALIEWLSEKDGMKPDPKPVGPPLPASRPGYKDLEDINERLLKENRELRLYNKRLQAQVARLMAEKQGLIPTQAQIRANAEGANGNQ